ncbi:MAG: U32 family peptidase, partial [Oscillospiraceae bacterium]
RKNADNFDDQQLKEACDFAHERGVKVYETLNVLMLQGETDELLKALETACRIGVDGIMVQDFGVLSIIKKAAPSMKCFASTQMAVHNLDGVLKAAELGCSRVVLARELNLHQIKDISE